MKASTTDNSTAIMGNSYFNVEDKNQTVLFFYQTKKIHTIVA
ncbi:hypothetical protein BTN49_0127 [Candidatus Enterovibrio escicola]|uniref:Uncharacterized protein n=1 Tax=Candidatus Enterovibrio escicola TaxID=1927127 RepID=A0A2A5T7I0_9GAMM|nr:hypothetical protein BTN49_0127 [Candidatus Enterovibrio escacola]